MYLDETIGEYLSSLIVRCTLNFMSEIKRFLDLPFNKENFKTFKDFFNIK